MGSRLLRRTDHRMQERNVSSARGCVKQARWSVAQFFEGGYSCRHFRRSVRHGRGHHPAVKILVVLEERAPSEVPAVEKKARFVRHGDGCSHAFFDVPVCTHGHPGVVRVPKHRFYVGFIHHFQGTIQIRHGVHQSHCSFPEPLRKIITLAFLPLLRTIHDNYLMELRRAHFTLPLRR